MALSSPGRTITLAPVIAIVSPVRLPTRSGRPSMTPLAPVTATLGTTATDESPTISSRRRPARKTSGAAVSARQLASTTLPKWSRRSDAHAQTSPFRATATPSTCEAFLYEFGGEQ